MKKNPPTYYEAKPNPLFTDEQTALVRFVRFKDAVECGHCKRRSKTHWTSLVPFRALDMENQVNPFILDTKSGPLLSPLTPVCRGHLLAEDEATMRVMIGALRQFFNITYKRLAREHAAAKGKAEK